MFLSIQEMQSWTTCSAESSLQAGGDLVNWKSAEWELENMIVEEKSEEEICKPVRYVGKNKGRSSVKIMKCGIFFSSQGWKRVLSGTSKLIRCRWTVF